MDALTIAAIGMENDVQRLNSISQNLANVSTSGYKRAVPVTRPFASYLDAQATSNAASSLAALNSSSIDASAGTLRKTGNPLNLAIDGEGFFEVSTERGLAYTRQGMLRVDPNGRLVTEQGHALMGSGGELSVTDAAMTIDANGEIRQGERLVGQIKLVRFADPHAMTLLGNGLYSQGEARLADKGTSGQIRAGYQENSNVNSPQEMVRLSETLRHFESMQKVMQGVDDLFEKTIRKLGEF